MNTFINYILPTMLIAAFVGFVVWINFTDKAWFEKTKLNH